MKYILPMFPFTSGKLHLGHFRLYVLTDVIARQRYGSWYSIPIGFDCFGIAAENAAKANNQDPHDWVSDNIETMKVSLQKFGCNFDFSSELRTDSPQYYKHTQRLFLILYEQGLVVRKKSIVHYDPVENTSLSESEIIDGKGERSGATIIRKLMDSWYINIGKYADKLLSDLKLLDWPQSTKKEQQDWIGRSDFVNVPMLIEGTQETVNCVVDNIIHPIVNTFAIIEPFHQILSHIPKSFKSNVEKYQYSVNSRISGVFTGLYLINPEFNLRLPVYISDLASNDEIKYGCVYTDEDSHQFFRQVVKSIETNLPRFGDHSFYYYFDVCQKYRLKEWNLSRQRKWGTPIPIIYCESCGIVPNYNLPVLMDAPLKTSCPKCGNTNCERETDTMDVFFDSSWYWLRYLDPKNSQSLIARQKAKPVDIYLGGREHTIGHLIYSRFITKVLYEAGLIGFNEPFKKLVVQGMVRAYSYRDDNGKYYTKEQVNDNVLIDGKKIKRTIEKMGKSKLNGIDPGDLIEKYGLDACRLYILYRGKVSDDIIWEETGIKGMKRLLCRLERIVDGVQSPYFDPQFVSLENLFWSAKSFMDKFEFHRAITSIMEYTKALQHQPNYNDTMRILKLISCITPDTSARLIAKLKKLGN